MVEVVNRDDYRRPRRQRPGGPVEAMQIALLAATWFREPHRDRFRCRVLRRIPDAVEKLANHAERELPFRPVTASLQDDSASTHRLQRRLEHPRLAPAVGT